MIAVFEYSIDYNITYQEGNFTIKNFVFEKLVMNNEEAYDDCLYVNYNPHDERDDIKDYIFAQFKVWLISLSRNYIFKKGIW